MSDSMAVDRGGVLPRGGFMAWLVCLSAGLFFFYEFFQLNIFDVINQPLRHDFNLDATQLSWMSSTYLWADILFLLPAGIILDRFSVRRVILTAMLICVVGTVGFALTSSFVWASFFHFLSGIGNAFCFLSCVVLVSQWFPPRRQALVIGLLVTMAFLGGMMAHTPFARLNDHYGWRTSLLIDGGAGALLLIWIYMMVKDRPDSLDSRQKKQNEQTVFSGFMTALSNRQNWLAGFYTSFLNLPIMVLCALWGASYLHVVHQLPDMAASNVISLIFIGSIIGCPLAGWLSDRQGRRKPLMIAGALATLVTLIPLFLNHALSQTELSVIFFALGFFTSTQVISYPLVAESNHLEHTGAATGVASVLIMGGGGVGQVFFGWLMQYHAGAASQHYTIADFQYAMWMFPLTAIAALLMVLLTRETHCRRLD
ncbi:MFS transporter [Legionella spiritensis]|uniref:MFS transporter n=1 Tax=Legionella spiritensis TaxID=452 RepID=UPI000F6DE49F|nr:MFS transporter [Legionella spiritensis]VEG91871.1 major facilitator family transporter [Legionella spiritensis]